MEPIEIMMYLGIALVVGILGVGIIVSINKEKKLKESGKIRNRPNGFERYLYTFHLHGVTKDDVYSAVKTNKYSEMLVDNLVYTNDKSILFRSKEGWNAIFAAGKVDGNVSDFLFHFTVFRAGSFTMNMLLTKIEKTMLSLDPSVQVEKTMLEITQK